MHQYTPLDTLQPAATALYASVGWHTRFPFAPRGALCFLVRCWFQRHNYLRISDPLVTMSRLYLVAVLTGNAYLLTLLVQETVLDPERGAGRNTPHPCANVIVSAPVKRSRLRSREHTAPGRHTVPERARCRHVFCFRFTEPAGNHLLLPLLRDVPLTRGAEPGFLEPWSANPAV